MNNKNFKNSDIKDLYSKVISEKYNNNYEFERWFTSARLRLDYYMTGRCVEHQLKNVEFKNCLEVGPGPGTWTKFLFRKSPQSTFTLVDISEEMHKQFCLEMRQQDNVRYEVSDFLNYKTAEEYDLFFSSRAFEYVDEKKKFLQKLFQVMSSNSSGIIVTKNPGYRASLRNNTQGRAHHTGQIDADGMRLLLQECGFENIKIYPVIIRLPYIEKCTHWFTTNLFKKIYTVATDKLPFYAESYVVSFQKKKN